MNSHLWLKATYRTALTQLHKIPISLSGSIFWVTHLSKRQIILTAHQMYQGHLLKHFPHIFIGISEKSFISETCRSGDWICKGRGGWTNIGRNYKEHWPTSNPNTSAQKTKPSTKWKGTLQNERKYLQIVYLIKWFMPQIYKELIQLNSKIKQIIQLKIGRGTELFFFPKTIYRWPTGTWKGAQYHWLPGKCEAKPKWAIVSHLLGGLSSKRQKRETCALLIGM